MPEPAVPTLASADGSVTLRAHRESDAQGVLEQCQDPVSRQWTTVPLDYTLDQAHRFVRHVMPGGWADDIEWGFAVEAYDDAGAPRFAGTVSLRNEGEDRAEIAYGAHPWARGRGVMATALELLLDWGFTQRRLATVVWWANRGNWASRRLAWRLGFRHEGELRRWLPQRDQLLDAWVGTLLETDPRRPATPWLDVPRLTGGGVILRANHAGDVDRVVEACTDPTTRRWLGQLPDPYTRADAAAYLDTRPEGPATGTAVTWAIADPVTDVLLGQVNLFDVRAAHDAELGFWVHPDARSRGVGTAAARLAVRHALIPASDGGLGLHRVRALAAEGNTASRRVLEAAGLSLQGRQRRAVRVAGGLADAASYDIVTTDLALSPMTTHTVGGT